MKTNNTELTSTSTNACRCENCACNCDPVCNCHNACSCGMPACDCATAQTPAPTR